MEEETRDKQVGRRVENNDNGGGLVLTKSTKISLGLLLTLGANIALVVGSWYDLRGRVQLMDLRVTSWERSDAEQSRRIDQLFHDLSAHTALPAHPVADERWIVLNKRMDFMEQRINVLREDVSDLQRLAGDLSTNRHR